MILYPALDILDGKVVRLVRGDFAQTTTFPLDPVKAAKGLERSGAKCMHLVDLSGAKSPEKRQLQILSQMIEATDLKVQIGGGIRSLDEIEQLLKIGADRVVLGSLVITEPQLTRSALERFGCDRLTFALDVQIQDGKPVVMTHGWTQSSGLTFGSVLEPYLAKGLRRVLCTDIEVDGRMVGPNLDLYRDLLRQFPSLELQASGGIAELKDLDQLSESGVHSAVVGRALLAGKFTLEEALQHAQ